VYQYSCDGESPTRQGNSHPTLFPYDSFEAADGHVVIAAFGDGHWRALCRAMERPDLAAEYDTGQARLANREELRATIAEWTAERETADIVDALECDVPAAPVQDTADIFADHMLMTYNQEFGRDAEKIFEFFNRSYKQPRLQHLIMAPFGLRRFLREKIEREIKNHEEGKTSGISVKVNNFSDMETNELIRGAAAAGVPVRLIVRSMFSLVIDDDGPIEAISIVDKYLEHSRMMFFENDGDREVYLSSADFMPRNFDSRVETIFPVYDKKQKAQLQEYFEIQWADNTKARILDHDLVNEYRKKKKGEKSVRAQFDIEEYLRGIN